MIPRRIIVIDDEQKQASALAKTIDEQIEYAKVIPVWEEEKIIPTIEDNFFNLVVLDIRMDNYELDGIQIAEKIIEVNPFAKILFVSAYMNEYMPKILSLMQNGRILGFSDKKDYKQWGEELKAIISSYYESLDANPQQVSVALLQAYSDLKAEEDTYIKGVKFENFVSLLFRSIGFSEILQRVKDKSSNEIDLIVRNDLDDLFISKFGKYFLVECKNKPGSKIDKNDFILFSNKLKNTNELAEIGFLITTSTFTRTAYLEAMRESKDFHKVFFIDNTLIMQLIQADNMLEELKRIIDSQVKDN